MLSTSILVIKIFSISLISFGILGNLFSVLIFQRPTFKNNSISTYCQALAFSELYTILAVIKQIHMVVYHYEIMSLSDLHCKFFYYATACFNGLSGWIIAVYSVDKLLNMKRTRLTIIKKKSFQWTVISLICVFNMVCYIELPILLELKENVSNVSWISPCFVANMIYYNYFMILIATTLSIIPFSIMILMSILMIKMLRSSRLRLEHLEMSNNDQRRCREFKYAVSSITFNICFIAMRAPFLIHYTMVGYSIYLGDWYYEIAFLLYFSNSTVNFLIHIVSNSIFRSEMIKFFKPSNQELQN